MLACLIQPFDPGDLGREYFLYPLLRLIEEQTVVQHTCRMYDPIQVPILC